MAANQALSDVKHIEISAAQRRFQLGNSCLELFNAALLTHTLALAWLLPLRLVCNAFGAVKAGEKQRDFTRVIWCIMPFCNMKSQILAT